MTRREDRDWSNSPTSVSSIYIERTFQVECPDHGIVDQQPTYKAAVASRRHHWDTDHNAGKPT